MENFTTNMPSTTSTVLLVPVAASTAALVAYPCATSAHAATPIVDVQGISARAWDCVDATAAKRVRTAGDVALGFAVATTAPGSPAWSPPI